MGMMNPMMMGSMGSESMSSLAGAEKEFQRCPVEADGLWLVAGGIFVVGYPYGGMGMGMMGSKSDSTTQGLDSTRATEGKG